MRSAGLDLSAAASRESSKLPQLLLRLLDLTDMWRAQWHYSIVLCSLLPPPVRFVCHSVSMSVILSFCVQDFLSPFSFFQSVLHWSVAVFTICRHSSRVVAFLQAVARPTFRGPRSVSIARSQLWLGLPTGRFQSGGTCRRAAARARWWSPRGPRDELRAIWPKSRRRLLVTRWESGEQPVVPLTSAFNMCMITAKVIRRLRWKLMSFSQLSNIPVSSYSDVIHYVPRSILTVIQVFVIFWQYLSSTGDEINYWVYVLTLEVITGVCNLTQKTTTT